MTTSQTNAGMLEMNRAFTDSFPYLIKAAHDGVRLYDPDYALTKDASAYEKLQRDPIVKQALQIRYRTAAGGTWTCLPAREGEPDDEAAAAIMADILGNIDGFQNDRVQLAQAILRGASYAQIFGERPGADGKNGRPRRYGEDRKPREWWVPTHLRHYDKRFIRHVPDRDASDWSYTVELFQRDGSWKALTDADYLIRVVYEDDQGRFGYGRGLAESIFFYWYAAMQSVRFGLQGVERWANGVLIGKVDAINSIGDTSQTTASLASTMLDTLHNMRTNHAIVHGKEDEVTVLETSGTGHQMAMDFVRFCYDSITRLVAGSKLPSGGGDETGSLARAEVEQDTSEAVAQLDSEILDDAITRDLVELAWELNADNFADLGLSDAEMPRFKSQNEARQDFERNSRIVVALRQAGVPLLKSELYEKTGFTPPPEDAPASDVLEPAEGGETVSAPFPAPLQFRQQPKRCPDGTIMPKNGDCTGHEAAKDDDVSNQGNQGGEDDGGGKKPRGKKAPPGSQLPPEVLDALKRRGVTTFPPETATNIEVADLNAPDVDSKPVMRWRDRDARGRSVSRRAYTATFHARNAQKKFARIQRWRPRIGQVRQSLVDAVASGKHGTADHQNATVAAIIAHTGMRPGGSSGGRQDHFGATSLLAQHVTIEDGKASFEFVGKSGKINKYQTDVTEIVESVRKYKNAAEGGEMFPDSRPDGVRGQLPDGMLAKDLRTIIGTEIAEEAVSAHEPPPPPLAASVGKAKKQIRDAIKSVSTAVSGRLNNTPAVAQASYIHPDVLDRFMDQLGVTDEHRA